MSIAAGNLETVTADARGPALPGTPGPPEGDTAEQRDALERAIHAGELVLHYQPQVDVLAGWPRITGYEALVRWNTPGGAVLLPDSFVQLAERTGLSRALDVWVLRQATRTLASGTLDGLIGQREVSVNVSSSHLIEGDFAGEVGRILASADLDPRRLVVEITETAFIEDADRARDTLRRLRALGLKISLDDFGTGFSSLSYLQHLPVNEIKIDRSFVAQLPQQTESVIVSSTIELAQALGLSVIAEGVDDSVHVDWLRRRGCSRMQGFLFGRPGPLSPLPAR